MPVISILMAVHNGEQFLAETLASVAAQTFADFEFLIVDDASSDGSAAILASAAKDDERIRVITNETNLGLTKSLNRGLGEAKGEFIARIDADDVCLPQRLEVQLEYMREFPYFVGITSGYEMIDGEGRTLSRVDEALDSAQIEWLLGWNPPAPHPTYFFKRCPVGDEPIFYDEQYRTAQDFALWSRLAQLGPTARLPDVLIKYRRHEGAITHAKRHEQAQNCAEIGRANLAAHFPADVVAKLEPLNALFSYNAKADPATIASAVEGANAMLAHDANARHATHKAWRQKMTAGILADAILSRGGGLSSPASIAAFVWHARWHLPALARAVLSDPGTAIKSLRNRKQG